MNSNDLTIKNKREFKENFFSLKKLSQINEQQMNNYNLPVQNFIKNIIIFY